MRLTLTEDEKRRILGLHGSNLIMEQENPKVTQIQTYLKGKGYQLGNSGPNKDGVDGKWGSKTSAAVKAEFKVDLDDKGNIKAADAPAASGTTTSNTTTNTTTPDQKTPILQPTGVQSQSNLTLQPGAQTTTGVQMRTRG